MFGLKLSILLPRLMGQVEKKAKPVLLFAMILVMLIIACYAPPATAIEAFNVAEREIKAKCDDAYVSALYVGEIPRLVKGELESRVDNGKPRGWDLEYYSPKEHLWMKVVATVDNAKIWQSSSRYFEEGEIPGELIASLDSWQLDSPEAFQIARGIAEEHGKSDLVPIVMSLSRPLPSETDLEWRIVFFPKRVSEKTVAFSVTINARTGKVMAIEEPEYEYR